MKNGRGFSIIELMIIVSLIAILAIIAIPNYKAYRYKAMDADAISNLSTLYNYEKVFFNEFEAYSARLDQLGFQIDGVSVFNIGFKADFNNVPQGAPTGSATCTITCNGCLPPACNYNVNWSCGMPASNSTDSGGVSIAGQAFFSAEAHGHLDNTSCSENTLTNVHTITVDQNRNFVVNLNGQ